MNPKTQSDLLVKKFKMPKFNFFDIFVTLFCIAFALLCFYPIWYVFIASISSTKGFDNGLYLLPQGLNVDYYKAIFATKIFKNSIIISIIKTFGGTALSVVVTAMTAYAASKAHVKGMKFLNVFVVMTMYFSGGLIPTFLLYKNIGILGTIWPMILPAALSIPYFIIMRNYFSYSVSKELEEAAMLDGANQIRIFFSIILPISIPMIAAIGLFLGVAHWNDWTNFMVYVQKIELQPVAWVLRRVLDDPAFVNTISSEIQSSLNVAPPPPLQLRMTTIMISVIPVMLVYPFLQKYFTQGLMIGGVKG